MKEFDYSFDYKSLDFTDQETRKLYRIGRGEQGVLLVRPYTDLICAHWRFKTPEEAKESSDRIYSMFKQYKQNDDFILKNGNLFTVEPGIYIPKLGGIRIEDDVLIESGKSRSLTTLSRDLVYL